MKNQGLVDVEDGEGEKKKKMNKKYTSVLLFVFGKDVWRKQDRNRRFTIQSIHPQPVRRATYLALRPGWLGLRSGWLAFWSN